MLNHSYGINNMLYADSYDDFWGMSSSLSIGSSNSKVSLTVLPFN